MSLLQCLTVATALILFLQTLSLVSSTVLSRTDRITHLPGQPQVGFQQYSGYVTVDEKKQRALLYYLAEAETKPISKPLVLWLDGEPGCSSVRVGAFSENGILACQVHRIALELWTQDCKILALLIQNRISESFAVNFTGILLDHATAIVIGETVVVGNNVLILHKVTLGDGVLIGVGTCILGNITIGEVAKIDAGLVVLKDVPPRTTTVGNPARLLGGKDNLG